MAGARILLCDDHDALRSLAVRILSSEGHEVVGVASAGEALERLAAERFDLLVLDLHLGTNSGLAVLDDVPAARPPVLLMSGDFDPREGQRDAARYGVQATLAKPFDAREISAAVASLLGDATPPR